MNAELYDPVLTEHFGDTQFHEFRALVNKISDATTADSVANLDEVLLSVREPLNPRTNNGFRYSHDAYRLLCRRTCRGLFAQTTDLAGHVRMPDQPGNEFSIQEAIACFNAAVRTRFSLRIRDRLSLVRNSSAKTIVGMVAEEAAFMPMGTLTDMADDVFTGVEIWGSRLAFHDAYLRGVRLTVRYATKSPVITIKTNGGDQHFSVGCDLTSEMGFGESLRLGTFVAPHCGRGVAMRRYAKSTLKKTGKNFPKRLRMAFRNVCRAVEDTKGIELGLQTLASRQRLTSPYRDTRLEVLRELGTRLGARGLRSEIVDQIMVEFVGVQSILELDSADGLSTLSDLDLFLAICATSVECDVSRREFCELLASHLLRRGI